MSILTHPVTPIVAIVMVAAGVIAIVTKIASDRQKQRAAEEARRIRERVARQLIDERRSKPSPRPRLRPASAPAPERQSRRYVDDEQPGLFIPSLLTDYDPPRRDDSSSHHSSSHDSSSSHSGSDSGSSSSSDSGSSGGGGGGCD